MFFSSSTGQCRIAMKSSPESVLQAVAEFLIPAQRILVVTGAGMSADAGLPTYRGVGGLYEDNTTTEGLTIEEALHIDTFRNRPDISWKYLRQIAEACLGATPSPGHRILSLWQKWKPQLVVWTQNIDRLHHAAGSRLVIELHGRGDRCLCVDCGQPKPTSELLQKYPAGTTFLPLCQQCGGILRPDVVLFGEMLQAEAVQAIQFLRGGQRFDLVMLIGTSAQFPYIQEPLILAHDWHIPSVEINPDDTLLSRFAHMHIPLRASEALTSLHQLLLARPDVQKSFATLES